MKIITKTIPFSGMDTFPDIFTEDTFFLDIETLGFQSAYQPCYMIGCMYRKADSIKIRQYFCETLTDEAEMLRSFSVDFQPYRRVITFNGDTFDLPFLKRRCEHFHISFWDPMPTSLDLFKYAKKLKRLLQLPNCKQKTLEMFFHIQREDPYTGGELIQTYHNYVASQDENLATMLLLHNFEDVKYMLPLLQIFSYQKIQQGLQIKEISYDFLDSECYFQSTIKEMLPTGIQKQGTFYFFRMHENHWEGSIRPVLQTLKYFYPNHKDYHYLLDEQIIVPKLLSSTIDKSRKRNAKKEECYIEKQGYFLPAIGYKQHPSFYKNLHLFQTDYKDAQRFFYYQPEQLVDSWFTQYLLYIWNYT